MRLGVDIAHIDRFTRIAEHRRFQALVFTSAELGAAAPLGATRRVEHLTGKFAAKEAVAKALGTGFIRDLWWRDIEILALGAGAPVVRLHRRAAALARGRRLAAVTVTISHAGSWAVAVAACVPQRARRSQRSQSQRPNVGRRIDRKRGTVR